MVAVNGPTVRLPEVAKGPFHPPLPRQLVALVVVQVKVELPPRLTVVGLAVKLMVGGPGGGGGAVTLTVTEALLLPPAPVQDNVNVELAVSAPLD